MKELTVKEALEQEYVYYVYNDDGYQSLKDISDMEMDFDREDIRLVSKEPYAPCGMDSKNIAETIAEIIEQNHVEDTGDDTEQVYDAIMEIDFSEAEKLINEALSKLNYYRATEIKLIP